MEAQSNAAKFVLWMNGFSDAIDTPTPEQWSKIKENMQSVVGGLAAARFIEEQDRSKRDAELDYERKMVMEKMKAYQVQAANLIGASQKSLGQAVGYQISAAKNSP